MNQNTPYLLVSGGMAVVGVIAIVAITSLRPDQDNAVLIATIIGLLASTTASILSFQKSQQTHLSVNSRLDSFIASAEAAAGAKGQLQGFKEGSDSVGGSVAPAIGRSIKRKTL